MRLPLIKHLVQFVEENDEDFLNETLETLEYLTDSPAIKDEELDVLGELISNMYVSKSIKSGADKKQALNDFMKRVLGSIDQ